MQRRLLCLAAGCSLRLLMPKQNNVAFEPFARAGGVQVTSTKFIYSLDPLLLVRHALPTLSAFGDRLPKLWM